MKVGKAPRGSKRPDKPDKAGTGRPTLIEEYGKELIGLIKAGVSHEDAALYAGIAESTIYNWKARGAEDLKAGIVSEYTEILEGIRQAETEAKVRKVLAVEKGAQTDHKLALEILARKYPEEWGRKDYRTLRGDKDNPLSVVVNIGAEYDGL